MLKKNNNLTVYAQSLRKNATKEERHLWYDFLRSHPLQFKRQRVIGNYIVDFYCDKVKLVIELDGSQHYENDAQAYDAERTTFLNSFDITVLRFSNLDIQENFDGVCAAIQRKVCELSK